MKYDSKFERYTFAAVLLIFAAIIILSFLDFPSSTSVEITGVYVTETTTSDKGETAESESKSTTKKAMSSIVNLNTATAEELDAIPGIGTKRANDIIAYRDALGGYTSIDQIKNIHGFGEKIFNEIKDYITV